MKDKKKCLSAAKIELKESDQITYAIPLAYL
jgi:hypothetical protein